MTMTYYDNPNQQAVQGSEPTAPDEEETVPTPEPDAEPESEPEAPEAKGRRRKG